ncbi:MAG: SpoVA/SpoVAEb family sporulation membrane protein [Clostridia bacterium]|nr:SpoVA/SpoVAEb family sporulation membrane protein [Clostridia bacterium]
MNINRTTYAKFAEARAPKSPCIKNCARAFLVGGGICCGAQGLTTLYQAWGLDREDAGTVTAVTLVFLAALLTGLGVFDRIARWAGAGTLVPITGFANAVVSPAIDNKAEGWVLGVGAKIFTVAGPVLLYATLSGTAYGVIYWVMSKL